MPNQRFSPWVMWSLPLTFFGFQFILRLFPGLVITEFLEKYHINATDFGLFAALYYLGYASMQIPMAFLLDRYGPRKIISASALLCGVSTLLPILFDSWSSALLSRFLIGAGSVVGFLGVSKVISIWFPPAHYGRLVGLTFSFGLLGAVYGGKPLSLMIEKMGWEKVNVLLAIVALLISLFIFVVVKDKKTFMPKTHLTSLKKILTNRTLLILAFANFLMVGTLEGFADVWGVQYLMLAREISKPAAAGMTSFIFIGMLFGGPILAFFSEKFNAHYLVTMLCGILMSLALSALLVDPHLPDWTINALMFFIGLLCCYQVIIFAIGSKLVAPHLINLTIASLNCINMLGGSFFHTLIGKLMDYFQLKDSVSYTLESYTYTLFIIPIASLLGALLVALSKMSEKSLSREVVLQKSLLY